MQSPVFQDPQFLDASGVGGLNTAFGTVSGAIAALGSGVWAAAGLVSPEAMTTSFSGLVATIGLPAPWGVVTSGGALVRAHGTQTGQDTQSYTPTFSGLVPATGSITAYLAATITSIQQNPFPIPGPPAGDPSYNPNYVPTEGYATNLLSVALTAVSGQPNNVTSFELLRTTLTAGQVTISSWSTVGQQRATPRDALAPLVLMSGGNLTQADAQFMLMPGSAGLTHTLPPVSGAGGLNYHLFNASSGTWTIAAAGSDLIGTPAVPAGAASFVIPSSGSATLWGNAASGTWEVAGSQMFAALGGNSANPFLVANSTPATQQAIPRIQGDSMYAPILGNPANQFSMSTAAVGTNTTQGATTAFVLANQSPGASGANPTASVGNAVVDGSATTFMRSDAAPALAAGAASANVGGLGGVLTGTLPNPGMAGGAAVANIGYTPYNSSNPAGYISSVPSSPGGVGTYAICICSTGSHSFGSTVAGSTLTPSDGAGNASGSTFAGTWTCMGYVYSGASATLFLRIA